MFFEKLDTLRLDSQSIACCFLRMGTKNTVCASQHAQGMSNLVKTESVL